MGSLYLIFDENVFATFTVAMKVCNENLFLSLSFCCAANLDDSNRKSTAFTLTIAWHTQWNNEKSYKTLQISTRLIRINVSNKRISDNCKEKHLIKLHRCRGEATPPLRGANWRHKIRQSNDYFSRCDSNANSPAANTTYTRIELKNSIESMVQKRWCIWSRGIPSNASEWLYKSIAKHTLSMVLSMPERFLITPYHFIDFGFSCYRRWSIVSYQNAGIFQPRFQFSNEMSPQLHSKVWALKSKCSNFIR